MPAQLQHSQQINFTSTKKQNSVLDQNREGKRECGTSVCNPPPQNAALNNIANSVYKIRKKNQIIYLSQSKWTLIPATWIILIKAGFYHIPRITSIFGNQTSKPLHCKH